MGDMHDKKPFKVIIAGGGIAGLTLANCLEKHGIDYLLLEVYPEIAPQVGASIGFMPHGLRVFDQIGVYSEILKRVKPLDQFFFRNEKGELLAEHHGLEQSFWQRHGYPMAFLGRQVVLELLYNNLKDKSKIVTSNGVRTVELHGDSVRVATSNGETIEGDILVGADGVHSHVRHEMVRLADGMAPGTFSSSEAAAVSCDFCCVFGMSNPVPGIEPGSVTTVFRPKMSYLVIGGKGGCVFWFHFFKLAKRAYGSDIPRYTKGDEEPILKERENDPITTSVTFGDLVRNKLASNMTALPVFTFTKWHFDRIVTIGDSVHKFNPVTGQGGNFAAEGAAALASGLVKALDESPAGKLSSSQISSIFQKIEDMSRKRAKTHVDASHEGMRMTTHDSLIYKIAARYLVPSAGTEEILSTLSTIVPQAHTLHGIPVKRHPALIPFDDDLYSIPYGRSWRGWLLGGVFLLIALFGVWTMHVQSRLCGLGDIVEEMIVGAPKYTGNEDVDRSLAMLLTMFRPGVTGSHAMNSTLQRYFLFSLFPVLAIFSVEACRKRNTLKLISFTSFWGFLYQCLGIGLVGPLYLLSYLTTSAHQDYFWALTRRVPTAYAKSILPATILGFLVPTIAMYIPYSNPRLTELAILIWQPFPIYINFLLVLFARIHRAFYPEPNRTPDADKPFPDISSLNTIYTVSFLLGTLSHASFLHSILSSPHPLQTLTDLFVPLLFLTPPSPTPSFDRAMHSFWQYDFLVFFSATLLFCVVAMWDLKRVGRTRVSLFKAMGAIVLGTLVVGPAATFVGVWAWREGVMARVVFE